MGRREEGVRAIGGELPGSPLPFETQTWPAYLGDEVVVVGQVGTAVGTAIPPVTIIQVGLKRLGLRNPHHGGGQGQWPHAGSGPRGAEGAQCLAGRRGAHICGQGQNYGDSVTLGCSLLSLEPAVSPGTRVISILTH